MSTVYEITRETGEAIARARRFAARAGYRPEGPWSSDLLASGPLDAALLETAAPTAATNASLWAMSLGPSTNVAEDVGQALLDVPRDVDQVLLAVYLESPSADARPAADGSAIWRGFRRHPRLFDCVAFGDMDVESGWLLLPYERIAEESLLRYPAEKLAAERGLHMDMTRQAGPRSDAHLARYRLASERIGATARILDAACGFGYGGALLGREAPARRVTGVDISSWVVDYATDNFGSSNQRLRYRHADVCDLSAFPDGSFDAVVSFETIEHLLDPARFLRHVRRLLTTDGLFIASVPYRWIEDGDTGANHHDWYDASRLLSLCGRFLSVKDLWVQTAGGGRHSQGFSRGWRRCETLGEEPEGDVEWLVVVATKRHLMPPEPKPWLFLAPGVSALTAMAASIERWGIEPNDVCVIDRSPVADDDFREAMSVSSAAFGFHYGGSLPLEPALETVGDALDFQPGRKASAGHATSRLRETYPILDELQAADLVLTVRPHVPSDAALLAGLRPRRIRLLADPDSLDGDARDLTNLPGLSDNPLARFPIASEIDGPPWLTGGLSYAERVRPLETSSYTKALETLASTPLAAPLVADIASRVTPFAGVVVCDPLSRERVTSDEAAVTFYLHAVRALLRRTNGAVLVKTHALQSSMQIRALAAGLQAEGDRVRVMTGTERYLPLEAFECLTLRVPTLEVWGVDSSSLAAVKAWRGVEVSCVDADYLEPEIGRRARVCALTFSLRTVTLRVDDDLLQDSDVARLGRRWLPAPDVAQADALRTRVAEIDQERRAARQRFEETASRLVEADERARVAEASAERHAQENVFLAALLAAGGTRTWIWGAGASGRALLQHLRRIGVEPAGFLDGQSTTKGRVVDDLPVLPVGDASGARDAGALVLIASMYANDIIERLRADGDWRATVLVWSDSGAIAHALESVASSSGRSTVGTAGTVDAQALSEIVKRETKTAIMELLHTPPEQHPRQVNYARLAWLAAGHESAAYFTTHMQGALDLVSSDAVVEHAFALAHVEGLVLEFGVFNGRSLQLISSLTDQDVHGFDSFDGLPEDWTYFQKKGRFSRGGQLPEFERPNVRLHKGWFDATLPAFLRAHAGPVRFLHVDCDLYSSTVTVLQALKPRIVPGTVIVFDEYLNYPGWQQHEYKAFAEFIQQTGLRYRYLGFASSVYNVSVQIL